jgi:hypothetical protein
MAKRMSVLAVVLVVLAIVAVVSAQTSAQVTLEEGSITVDGVIYTTPPTQTISAVPGDMISWGTDAEGNITLGNDTIIDLTPPDDVPSGAITTIELALEDDETCGDEDIDDDFCFALVSGGVHITTPDVEQDDFPSTIVKFTCGLAVVRADTDVEMVTDADGDTTVVVVRGLVFVNGGDGSSQRVDTNERATSNADCSTTAPVPASGVGGAQLPSFYLNNQ